MLLQRLATGATGVKQARYRRGQRGTRTRMRSIYTACHVWKVLECETKYEFRRGFCTLVLSLSCVSVCLSVCVCICSRSSCFSVPQATIHTGFPLDFDSLDFRKLWRQYAKLTASRFRAVSKQSIYVKGNWWVECCFRG